LAVKKDKRKAASLTIRIFDNWGHQSLVGLTQIEVFESRGLKQKNQQTLFGKNFYNRRELDVVHQFIKG
jgi:hypothetical protein